MQQQQPGTQPPALTLGSILLRRYTIDGYIGGGGFGYIYQASDLALGHRRAIKEAFCRDANAEHQFRLEAEFLLNARHPNLVRGYAVFEHSGRLYLVMDYVDGQTLEDIAIEHIRRTGRAVGEAQVLDWMIPICAAAYELHSQPVPIIHRDIKPANIKLRSSDGAPILIDLGLAKLFAQGTQTLQAALAFTPGYAPPEQYQATGATDQRTDVYGLGASLFYLLTGYQPTEAPARLSAHALPAPRTLNPALSPHVEAIVLKAMALDPAERFQSAREMEQALRLARGELQGAALGTTSQPGASSGSVEVPRWPCMRCGTANLAAARFCMRCGSPMSTGRSSGGPRPGTGAIPIPLGGGPAYGQRRPPPQRARYRPGDGAAGMPRSAAMASMAGGTGVGTLDWMPLIPHSLAGLVRSVEQTWPFAGTRQHVRKIAQRALSLRTTPTELEAWVSICSLLAVTCVALSLLAAFSRVMLFFVVPALVLGHWCWAQPEQRAPREFRWLAMTAVVAGYTWVVVWLIVMIAHFL
jgi:hypothetical protein